MTDKNTEINNYAELASKANLENKVVYHHENGNYELIEQVTFHTCDYVDGEWVENSDKLTAMDNIRLDNNKDIYNSLMKEANTAISILQDAIDLDMQEDGDEDKLKAWKKYRILLSRMDLTSDSMYIPVKP